MTETEAERLAMHLADLRMQVNALEVAAKAGSLPEMLKQTRRAIWWSALLIAGALLALVIAQTWRDRRIEDLEERIQVLEGKIK